MATSTQSVYNLDPEHISCIGGRTVLTCQHCAGNAPRNAICTTCQGRGFNIYICAHCNPAAVATAVRANTNSTVSPAAASTTPGSSAPSSPGSLSRTPSTSYSSNPETKDIRTWRRYGDGTGQTSCGRVEANTPRNL